MQVDMNRLTDAIATDFKGLERKELEAYAEYMGVQFHPNLGDERLRGRILEKLGKEAVEFSDGEMVEPKEIPQGDLSVEELMSLNLTPNGAWEGRRYMISIVRPDSYKGNQPQPFNWGRYRVMVPWGKPVSVAYPIYQIIKNANQKELEQVRTTGRDGTPKIINELVAVNRFRFTDMGVDPETAHLPYSQIDQFRKVAEMTDYFKDWDVRKIGRLCRRLKLRYARGADYAELRDIVLTYLGYDIDLMELAA